MPPINFDSAINQVRGVQDPTERATAILQAIVSADTAAGVDKAKRQEFSNALTANVAKLAQTIAGD